MLTECGIPEPRILVVEPDRVRRASLIVALGDAGCRAEGVETAGDALAFFRGGGAAEAVVLDPEPTHDGDEVGGSGDQSVAAVLARRPTVVYSTRPGTQGRARRLGATAVVDSVPAVLDQLARLVTVPRRAAA